MKNFLPYILVSVVLLGICLGASLTEILNPNYCLIIFASLLWVFSFLYFFEPLNKDVVDIVYYSFSIVGIALFFLIRTDERRTLGLQNEYVSTFFANAQSYGDLKVLLLIQEDPEKAESRYRNLAGRTVGTILEEVGTRSAMAAKEAGEGDSFPSFKKFVEGQDESLKFEYWKSLLGTVVPSTVSVEGYSISKNSLRIWLDYGQSNRDELSNEIARAENSFSVSSTRLAEVREQLKESSDKERINYYLYVRLLMYSGWPYFLIILVGMKISRKSLLVVNQELKSKGVLPDLK